MMLRRREPDYCGCCGNECARSEVWCPACLPHVSRAFGRSAWDCTYQAQHGTPCPNAVRATPPPSATESEERG